MSHLISERAKARSRIHFTTANLKDAPEGFKPHPAPLVLDFGTPNAGFFPISGIQANVIDYPFQESLALPVGNASLENLNNFNGSSSTVVEDQILKLTINVEAKNRVQIAKRTDDPKLIDLARGLQYSEVEGIPQLRNFTKELIKKVHPPAYDDWTTILSNGAGDGLNKAADCFLNEGEVVLIEEFTFTPFLQNVSNVGAIPVPVKLNLSTTPGESNGIDFEYLKDLLENWDERRPELKGKKPKALYTIATGQNPTGLTQNLEFRKKVYALAEKFDFVIIEDDPYGYLSLPPYSEPTSIYRLSDFLTVDEYLKDHLEPSYLTIDTSGRVLRIETFSKLFAPGLRLGFIVGHKNVIEAISNYANVVTRSSSGTSQLLVNNVIEQSFRGVDGWLEWILKMRHTYTNRRNVLLFGLYQLQAYKAGYIDVIDPRAGIFVSVIIKFPEGVDAIKKIELLQWKFREYGVRVVAGINMAVDREFSVERGHFFRLTYAPANNDEELVEGAKRFGEAVYDFFQKGLEF